ncbi:MAG: glycoside hydrolase family 2 TIM barrel-domain containing protein [Eubacteriales bacterium]|nr:glycoside hydrolase family 2 TIM barrel-domain containing protein [Eubacteriales bacterium]
MKKLDFNEHWKWKRLEEPGEGERVTLPHDAMCRERRSQESRGGHNIGWFESSDYVYEKEFDVPQEDRGKTMMLEFEGVYRNAEVYVNGQKAAYRPYGYTNFYVDLTALVRYGERNSVRVIARNADQPNSRWYTGSGIYRPVWLYVGGEQYVAADGVRIRTLSCGSQTEPARIAVGIRTARPGEVSVEITEPGGRLVAAATAQSREEEGGAAGGGRGAECGTENGAAGGGRGAGDGASDSRHGTERARCFAQLTIEIPHAQRWSPAQPRLYTCTVRCGEDCVSERFGIRTLGWDAARGLTINGERVILKGACIHHDNGPLGACAFPEAEERKIRLLMENGYNAVRSAHNPCSKAMLEACDRLGMLVMDEYTDMWYIHKNRYDYASYMEDWWRQDLADMVAKDYNHPSVVLYSTGNEVAETAQKRGIALTGAMTEYLHGLDESRPVSCGINIFFNLLYSMGLGVYSDEKAKKQEEQAGAPGKKAVGSEFYNTMAGLLGDKAMKIGATLYPCDVKTRDAYANMDVAGYNYGIYRYRHDLKKYPERLILGSETFCRDAYLFYEMAKREERIIGDFVWAGMDYMGEAGIGAWEYADYAPSAKDGENGRVADGSDPGWLTAGSGRLDILGFAHGEAAYTRVALEKERGPLLAVRPVYQKGAHSPSAWKMTDAMESWSWDGCEGERASVEIYARAHAVELFLNGRSQGRKRMKRTCAVTFRIPYESGELLALSYDSEGKEIGRCVLKTAGKQTRLTMQPESERLQKGGIGYLRLRYTDENGVWKPMERRHMQIRVENGTLLGFGNACPYNPDGYWKESATTYYGEALAVVRAAQEESVRITVTDEDGAHELEWPVR